MVEILRNNGDLILVLGENENREVPGTVNEKELKPKVV